MDGGWQKDDVKSKDEWWMNEKWKNEEWKNLDMEVGWTEIEHN